MGGRVGIWQAIFQELSWDRRIWLHGCAPGYIYAHLKDLTGRGRYTHNQFLEILVGQGLAPLLAYCAWLVCIARDSLSLCFSKTEDGESFWTLPVVLLVLVIANLMEAMLAGTTHYIGHLFFLISGFVAGTYVPKKNKKSCP